jgi:hypothetical protein
MYNNMFLHKIIANTTETEGQILLQQGSYVIDVTSEGKASPVSEKLSLFRFIWLKLLCVHMIVIIAE